MRLVNRRKVKQKQMNQNKYLPVSIEKFGNNYLSSGDDIRYDCPFCYHRRGKADLDKKLYVNIKTGVFHCFKCGAKGFLGNRKIVEPLCNVYKDIDNYCNTDYIDDEDDNVYYVPNTRIRKGTVAYEYCMSRGITEDIIDYYNIRLGMDDLMGRIVIPNQVFGNTGVWTDMYSSRTYIDQIPKYKNPKGCKKAGVVFNLHRIQKGCDKIYGVEGAITAIGAGKEAVAFYGCHPSKQQILSVAKYNPKNFYACLDNDAAGRGPNMDLADEMSKLIDGNVYVVYLPNGQDAADLGESKFKEYVEDNKMLYHSGAFKSVMMYFNS